MAHYTITVKPDDSDRTITYGYETSLTDFVAWCEKEFGFHWQWILVKRYETGKPIAFYSPQNLPSKSIVTAEDQLYFKGRIIELKKRGVL